MTPMQCIETARRAEEAARKARERLALLAVTFGGASELAQRAESENIAAMHAAAAWRQLAAVHPQTRARILRSKQLPTSIFGY